MREQLEGIASAHVEIDHMVGLVEQDAGLGPCALLIPPIRELGSDHGIHVGADLRVTHHLYCIAGSFKRLLQIPVDHRLLPLRMDARTAVAATLFYGAVWRAAT